MTLLPSIPNHHSSPSMFSPFDSISLFNSREFDSMFEKFDKMFDHLDFIKVLGNQYSPVPCDVITIKDDEEKEIGLELRYAVAGYNKEDISVDISQDNTLNIFARKSAGPLSQEQIKENKNNTYLVRSIKKSDWSVSYKIGIHVNKEKITSKFKDGILSVNVPYLENEKKEVYRKIKIE